MGIEEESTVLRRVGQFRTSSAETARILKEILRETRPGAKRVVEEPAGVKPTVPPRTST